MSRIGAMPIRVPDGVRVDVQGSNLTVSGKSGSANFVLLHGIKAILEDGVLSLVSENRGSAVARVLWGSYRSGINNAVIGFSRGFAVELEIYGVGYRADSDGKCLSISMGFSHGIRYVIPEGIEIKCLKPTQLVVRGFDKMKVHMVASDLCSVRRCDPYKGKGIFVKGKYVCRKVVNKKK